jgi:hypothetical protein
MGKRVDALWRLWALIWQATFGYLALGIIAIVALLWMIVDVAWQLVTGRDGLSSMSTVAMQVENAFDWTAGQTVFALTGGGDGWFYWTWMSGPGR